MGLWRRWEDNIKRALNQARCSSGNAMEVVVSSNLETSTMLTTVSRGFPQSLQANASIVPPLGHDIDLIVSNLY